jgi:hypothetical protein
MARRRRKGTAWLTARRAFDSAARERFGPDVRFEVGWASVIGHGLHRTIYSAVITPASELLDSYNAEASIELRPERVHVHEILVALNWLRESLSGESQHLPSTERQRLAGLLRRVGT